MKILREILRGFTELHLVPLWAWMLAYYIGYGVGFGLGVWAAWTWWG